MTHQVRPFSVGPILGHVGTDCARIFARAFPGNAIHEKPNLGRLRIRKSAGSPWASYAFRLNHNFDWSGLREIRGLDPSTTYQYQAGWVDTEDESAELSWSGIERWSVRTASDSPDKPMSFLLGSCLYPYFVKDDEPGETEGAKWTADSRFDKSFRAMVEQFSTGSKKADLMLLLGDQVYADPLNVFPAGRAETYDQYLTLYHKVFASASMRAAMAKFPTYLAADDHEIEDNFPEHEGWIDRWRGKTLNALRAYRIYQASHSPAYLADAAGFIKRDDDELEPPLWYTLESGCAEFFVTDSRFERDLDGREPRLIGREQEDALMAWLSKDNGRVKFVASGVPMFPDDNGTQLIRRGPRRRERVHSPDTDKWSGFAAQRRRILDHVAALEDPRVVFLAGDIHAHFCSELRQAGRAKALGFNVVSSGLHWPEYFPLNKLRWTQNKLRLDRPLYGADQYTASMQDGDSTFGVFSNANGFSRLRVRPDKINVELYNRKGKALSSSDSVLRF